MTAYESVETTVALADFIVLATPLSAYESILKTAAPHMKHGALVMDLGSVKLGIEALFSRCLSPHQQLHWVGGHPMCGSDKTGAAHADGNLFQGASFFLTGHLAMSQAEKLERLLVQIGARPIWVSEAHHDAQVAVTSHLPHLSAAALMHCAAVQAEAADFMAGGFEMRPGLQQAARIFGKTFYFGIEQKSWRPLNVTNISLKPCPCCLKAKIRQVWKLT